MDRKHGISACGPETCGTIVHERNRYFTGKYMTRRDFQADQDYFLSRHRLHNRLLHGWGVVCGLQVTYHPDRKNDPDSACARRWVVVHPGVAFDCCGRELVLGEREVFELPLAESAEGKEQPGQATQLGQQPNKEPTDEECHDLDRPFLLGLRYVEQPVEQVPALYAEGECDPTHQEYNRVRERVELAVICDPDEVERCWQATGGDPDYPCRNDCAGDVPGPAGTCLEPDCTCGRIVPLAKIYPETDESGQVVSFTLVNEGRRELPPPANYLTHVVYHNWPHGGDVRLSELRDEWDGELRVRFDRRLLPGGADDPEQPNADYRNGVNPFTFVVQFGGIQHDVEYLPFDSDAPPEVVDDCWAVFTIDRSILRRSINNLANNVVYVSLKCDFILDCHGNAVDGNHLAGRLPSGNGVPGGIFESWFRVLPDAVYADKEDKWQQQA